LWGLRQTGSQIRTSQRDPEIVFGPSVFLEAWGTKANKPHMFKTIIVFGLAAEGGKAQQPLFS
jgi:hypothetical protein